MEINAAAVAVNPAHKTPTVSASIIVNLVWVGNAMH
jgi:hypothetical protein